MSARVATSGAPTFHSLAQRLGWAVSRRSTRDLTPAEKHDLMLAQIRATRPIVSGVLLCGAVLLSLTGLFELAGVTPSIGYPWWLVQLAALGVGGCALGVTRLTDWRQRLALTMLATLLIGVFMSMPLPGSVGQLALRAGLFQLLPLALMALMVRPASLLALAVLIVSMAYARIVVHGAPGTGSALYWLYTLTTIGFGTVLAGFRTDFAVSAWRMRRRLMLQAYTDELTGLLNRSGWNDRAAQAHASAQADLSPPAVVFFDIDHFKVINDRLGHEGGDAVLQRLGGILKARVADDGCAARIGGEEFAVLLNGRSAAAAVQFAERVRAEFAKASAGLQATLCAGVAHHRAGESLREQMRRADMALYAAKHAGRDRTVVAPAPNT